jgi:hypothetical protein
MFPDRQLCRKPHALVVHTGALAVSSIDDLERRAVAVLHASYTHCVLDKRGVKVRTLYPTEADILEAVDKGERKPAWYLSGRSGGIASCILTLVSSQSIASLSIQTSISMSALYCETRTGRSCPR